METAICHPAQGADLGGEPLHEVLANGTGQWVATGLAQALRQCGPRVELVHRLSGRPERLSCVGMGGASVSDASSWGGNGRADIPAIMAVARALGAESGRLGAAIARALPRGLGRSAECRLIAHCGLPSPICEGEPMGVYLQIDETDPARHALADRWGRLLMKAQERRRIPTSEWAAWLEAQGPRVHKRIVTGYRAGGVEGQAGVITRFFRHVQHIDLSQAYARLLEALELRRCGTVLRPAGYSRPGGDVTGLIPGSLDVPDVLAFRSYRWDPSSHPDHQVQVETHPAPALTRAVRHVLATARAEGGKAGFRAAGRVLYGMLHGSVTGVSWPRISDVGPGVYRTVAGRAMVTRPRALPPYSEPAAAWQVLDECRAEVERAMACLRAAGHTIIGADTDGLIVGGPRPPLDDLGTPAPWASWGVKWAGHLAWSGPRHYIHQGAVVWAGAETGGRTWRALQEARHEAVGAI